MSVTFYLADAPGWLGLAHQQEHRLLPDFLLVPSRKAVQVAQVHKSNIGLLFNIDFNNLIKMIKI